MSFFSLFRQRGPGNDADVAADQTGDESATNANEMPSMQEQALTEQTEEQTEDVDCDGQPGYAEMPDVVTVDAEPVFLHHIRPGFWDREDVK